jgi:hypothetical protein
MSQSVWRVYCPTQGASHHRLWVWQPHLLRGGGACRWVGRTFCSATPSREAAASPICGASSRHSRTVASPPHDTHASPCVATATPVTAPVCPTSRRNVTRACRSHTCAPCACASPPLSAACRAMQMDHSTGGACGTRFERPARPRQGKPPGASALSAPLWVCGCGSSVPGVGQRPHAVHPTWWHVVQEDEVEAAVPGDAGSCGP